MISQDRDNVTEVMDKDNGVKIPLSEYLRNITVDNFIFVRK